ncbi:MAG: UDP-N-acetylglucosamine 2-epimerase (non-hydrolyzing) [Myxococcota bacterium]|nr:UDP-N-acetylglucosamine 2-epimerase (non-hydrolyzing) [Myxococcota bacterium]
MRIINVVGARPNFMKIAPLMDAWRSHAHIEPMLVHTGQHHDHVMSSLFFSELSIPKPDLNLGIHGGTHISQHVRVMAAFDEVCVEHRPDLVLVVGDVNSTLSCALVAAKLGIRVAHVEAGLRSFDRTMPEEINRVLTDNLCDYLFVSEKSGLVNLAREGLDHDGVYFTGNVMIDSLMRNRTKANRSTVLSRLNLPANGYAVLTMHRPANVDDPHVLSGLIDVLARVSAEMPIVFPAHPRTLDRLDTFRLRSRIDAFKNLILAEPMGYLDFLHLVENARVILTDSGGIQEETTVLRVPCVTLRESTERPATCTVGTNRLAGTHPDRVWTEYRAAIETDPSAYGIPDKWDGKAAERIANIVAQLDVGPRRPSLAWTRSDAMPQTYRVED